MEINNPEPIEKKPPKTTIEELDLFDVPMVGIFKNKKYTAYTLSTLAGIEVKDLNSMSVTVEDFLENTKRGRRNMRMDARINIRNGEERANIEIQRLKKKDEAARALSYGGGLVTDLPRGAEEIPETKNTVIFICNFDPFAGTPYEGQTRMRFTLKSEDDEARFHTVTGAPYPFDGLTIILYNGAQDWERNPPKSEEEEKIRVYLEDMKKNNPDDMVSEIAKEASKEYKEDPKIMSKTKDWIRYNFADQFDEQAQMYERMIKKAEKEKAEAEEVKAKIEEENVRLKEENANNLLMQKMQFAENLLSSTDMSLSEISKVSGLSEKEVKDIKDRIKD